MWWDCFSPYIDVRVRSRLDKKRAELINYRGEKNEGTYLFTLDWSWESKSTLNTNFSETPEHKCAHFFKMDNGNFYAYPNNKILWYDDAWTRNRITKNPGYEIDLTEYSVENRRKIETSDDFMSYLNHNLPTITCYIRNEFLYNHKKGHGEVTLCDVHSVASLEKHVPLFEALS